MRVDIRREGHVAIMTLDDPGLLNAVSTAMLQELSDAMAAFEADDDLWVGVVTGAGERAFCAGADIKTTIRAMTSDPSYRVPLTMMRGQDITKPLIAAVNGVCLGGGLEVALACDLRIASEKARFGAPEVKLGLIPGWGGTQRLPRQIPFAIASDLILRGRMLSAEDAVRYGLVNEVVAHEAVLPRTLEIGQELCNLAPLALRAAKQAIRAAYDLPMNLGLDLEQRLFDGLGKTADAAEGIAAFEAKRPPAFEGR